MYDRLFRHYITRGHGDRLGEIHVEELNDAIVLLWIPWERRGREQQVYLATLVDLTSERKMAKVELRGVNGTWAFAEVK